MFPDFFLVTVMSLARLVDHFKDTVELPVEIPDVREVIIGFGIQDDIICVPADSDPGRCRGVYYQFTNRDGVYGNASLISLIVYSSQLDVPWQRVICAKEMIHIMDAAAEKTNKEEDAQALIEKLLGPLSTEDVGLADLMAAVDKLALYQCLTFLFPDAARAAALKKLASNERTIEEIAEWSSLPLPLVKLVMSDRWPELKTLLLA